MSKANEKYSSLGAMRCSTDFDPSTASSPWEKRIPNIPVEATEREQKLMEQYTRISYVTVQDEDNPEYSLADATHAWLVVGAQSFCVSNQYFDSRDEASWLCWMVAKALSKVITSENL